MAVEKYFWIDPYLTELKAHITGVDKNVVTLDRTIAFAFSGGQSSDSGTIGGYDILKAEKVEREIFYTLDEKHDLLSGQEVLVKIDWSKRYKLMKLHFAAEILLELVYQNFDRPEKIGAHITEDKARLDFLWNGSIAAVFPFLEEEAGKLINADLDITSAFSDRENEVRYWEIKGFGKVPCGGTHIRRTGEIGGIALKRNNIGKGKERIEITLAE